MWEKATKRPISKKNLGVIVSIRSMGNKPIE